MIAVVNVGHQYCVLHWCALAGANGIATDDKDKSKRKLAFTLEALETADPFVKEVTTPVDVLMALEWQSVRSPAQVMQEREHIISSLELEGAAMWRSGRCAEWFLGCDPVVQVVSKTVNGPMLQDLATAVGHADSQCPDVFRKGLCVCAGLVVNLILHLVW